MDGLKETVGMNHNAMIAIDALTERPYGPAPFGSGPCAGMQTARVF